MDYIPSALAALFRAVHPLRVEAVLQLPDPAGEYRHKSRQVLGEIKKIPGE